MKTTIFLSKHSMNPPCRFAFLLIPVALVCFGLAPQARAACQEGCLTDENTVLGEDALVNNTAGINNTAVGNNALSDNTTGGWNTAVGRSALAQNTTGSNNTAVGSGALVKNTTGVSNTGTGLGALQFNTIGFNNTATGSVALGNNTTGNSNTANGVLALWFNITGSLNTATGRGALNKNQTGSKNTAEGHSALRSNTTGSSNIALGNEAGSNLTTGDNNIDIGNQGVAEESNTIRVGTEGIHTTTYIAGVSGATVPTGVPVIVDTNGHLGVTTSSARFKDAIKPMDKTSEAILALKPVTFRYKQELDPDGIPQFGLVAEDVEKVNPNLVARDEQGKPYTVRYEAVNAMLLNEFLKEHRKNERQEATIADLKAEIATLSAAVKAHASQIQKMSAQLEPSKPVMQTIADNH